MATGSLTKDEVIELVNDSRQDSARQTSNSQIRSPKMYPDSIRTPPAVTPWSSSVRASTRVREKQVTALMTTNASFEKLMRGLAPGGQRGPRRWDGVPTASLIARYPWPAPLTIVCAARFEAKDVIANGDENVFVR